MNNGKKKRASKGTAGKPEPRYEGAGAAMKPDPRRLPAPTAPAAVAEKAAEAIASTATVATAAPKRSGAAGAAVKTPVRAEPVRAAADKPAAQESKAAPKPASAEAALASPAGKPPAGGVFSPQSAVAPFATALEAGANQARAAYAKAHETGESFRQAIAESTTAATRGVVEFNSKILDLLQAQNDATIDLWRSTLAAGSFAEAVRVQTSGLRQAYEIGAAQWKDLTETAGRLVGEAAKPLQSAWTLR